VIVVTFRVSVAYWRYMLTWIQPKRAGMAAVVQMSMLMSLFFYLKQYPNNSKRFTHIRNNNNNIPGQCLWRYRHESESSREFTRWMQSSARWLPIFGPSC